MEEKKNKCKWCETPINGMFCDSDCAWNMHHQLKIFSTPPMSEGYIKLMTEEDEKLLEILNTIKPKQTFKLGD